LPVGSNIGSEQEAASSVPNIVPAPIQAPEGATTVNDVKRQNSTLHAVWQCGADGKLERIVMNIVSKNFNRDMFAQTFGHDDIPPWLSGCLRNDCT
jgi:hypothetical protein